MRQTIDEPRFQYQDDNGREAWCHLQVWEEPDCAPIVIVTELQDNPGTCITDAAETFWPTIWEFLERPALWRIMIEHYILLDKFGENGLAQTFERVHFKRPGRFTNPSWRLLQLKEL